jgi:hypothetical protein
LVKEIVEVFEVGCTTVIPFNTDVPNDKRLMISPGDDPAFFTAPSITQQLRELKDFEQQQQQQLQQPPK